MYNLTSRYIIYRSILVPLSPDPSVEEVQGRLGLVHRNHVSSTEDLHKCKVAAGLDLAELLSIVELQVLDLGLVEVLLTWPLESFSPALVTEPVTDKVGITSINQNWDLLKDTGNEAMEWLHPVTLEQEVPVDIEVARIVAADFGTESIHDILLVQVLADIAEGRIAKVALILALSTDIINVLASFLVWANHGIIAVDTGRDA